MYYLPWGLLPVGRAQKTSKGRLPRGILIWCPNHLNWLLSMWRSSDSTWDFLWMSELLISSLRVNVVERRLIRKSKALPSSSAPSSPQRSGTTPTLLFINSPVDPRLLHLGQQLSLTPEEAIHIFLPENHVPRLWGTAIVGSPNQTLSSSQICLEILVHENHKSNHDNPGRAQHPLKTCLTSCQEYRHSSHSDYIS